MKSSLFLIVVAFLCSDAAFSQDGCYNAPISPSVTQPTQAGIVSSTCSTLMAKWQGNANQTYCVTATYFKNATNTKDTAFGVITCDASQSCTATISVISGTKVTWSVQAISNDNSSYPAINVLEYPICGCSGSGVTFCGKIMMQGAYDITTKKMNNKLNSSGILQAQAINQPYNSTAFGYTGTKTIGVGFFAAHPDIVDWILVELRDPNVPSNFFNPAMCNSILSLL